MTAGKWRDIKQAWKCIHRRNFTVALAIIFKLTCKAQHWIIRQVSVHEHWDVQGSVVKRALEGCGPQLQWQSGTSEKCYIKKERRYGQKFPDEGRSRSNKQEKKLVYYRRIKQSRWRKMRDPPVLLFVGSSHRGTMWSSFPIHNSSQIVQYEGWYNIWIQSVFPSPF